MRQSKRRNSNRKRRGGSGAAEHALNVYGNGAEQHAISANNNQIASKTGGGVLLSPADYSTGGVAPIKVGGNLLPTVQNMAVPAVLLTGKKIYESYSKNQPFIPFSPNRNSRRGRRRRGSRRRRTFRR